MHHIYHTKGLILGSNNFSEAGRFYSIFTEDLGMIYASAQGVRKISAKLRFVLQDYSYVKIDLVRGKDFWRITSASKTNKLDSLTKKPGTLRIFANIGKLLQRLLTGEEVNKELFIDLVNGLSVLEKIAEKNSHNYTEKINEELQNIEVIIVLRLLNNLGYIGNDKILENVIKSPFEDELIFEVSKSRLKMLSLINKAIGETQL